MKFKNLLTCKRRRSSAMVAALIFIVVGCIIIGGYLSYITSESYMTKYLNDSIKAFYIAEAGLERACRQTYLDWYGYTPGNPATWPRIFKLNGISLTNFPDSLSTYGRYEVTETWVNVNLMKRIASTGTYANQTRTIYKDVYHPQRITGAIISCSGSLGKIKGNVKIMGSVYISGEEPFVDKNENNLYDLDLNERYRELGGDPDHWGPYLTAGDSAFGGDITGTSEIGNNYEDMPSDLKSRVPSIFDTDISMDTLNAELLIKYGKVSAGGNATIGHEETESDSKDEMDSVIIPDGDLIQPSYIHTNEYLSGEESRSLFNDEVRIPSIRDKYMDHATGVPYPSPADPYGVDASDDALPGGYEAYLHHVAYDGGTDIISEGEGEGAVTKVRVTDSGVYINGDFKITPEGFYINGVSAPYNNQFSYGNVSVPGKGGVSIDGIGNLIINGLIYVNGKLTIDSPQGKGTILYSGRGSFYARGHHNADISDDVVINTNLLTKNISIGAFPTNAIGIMTRENISFEGSQNHVMGAFYAENTITMTMQYEIAGTVMSTYFDMTRNVPDIFQVPKLADNPPDYMLPIARGGEKIIFKEWAEH